MAYYPTFQPYPYQDQLNQLRSNQMQMQGQNNYLQSFQAQPQMSINRPDSAGLNWVQGEAGAKSWFVNPGATVLLMDSENQRFYVKSADMNGVPAMRTFEYNEVGPSDTKSPEVLQSSNFVTIDAFNAFRSDVLKRLNDLSEPAVMNPSKKERNESADE